MQSNKESLQDVRQAWSSATDQAVYQAMTHDLDEYSLEVQEIIKKEAQYRDLSVEAFYATEPIAEKAKREVSRIFYILLTVFVIIIFFIVWAISGELGRWLAGG